MTVATNHNYIANGAIHHNSGKTSSNATMVEFLIRILQGRRDNEGHRPRLLVGGITLAHLEKTLLAYIKQDLATSKTDFKHDTKNNILSVGDVDVILTPLQNPKEIAGYDVWAALLEEVDDLGLSTAEDTTFEAVKAVNERIRQRIPGLRTPFMAMGSTSQGQRGLYRLYSQFRKAGTGFTLIRGRTADNYHLDPEYVKSLYDIYDATEREVYLEGKFLAISKGQVFGSFDWSKNYIDYDMDRSVAPNETIYWGQDFNQGYHRGCVAVLRNGTIYIVKRYEFPSIFHAPSVLRHDFPTQRIFFIPDSTAKEEITHFIREIVRYDIRLISRTKNPLVEDSAFLVNKLLYTGRMMIAKSARETAEAMSLAQRDSKGMIPKGVGPSSPIHDCLAGNTKVLTRNGNVRMDRLRVGDEVLTRSGWRRVSAFMDKGMLPVRKYAGVWATKDHPFWTDEHGMKYCSLLTKDDSLRKIDRGEVSRWILSSCREKTESLLKEFYSTEGYTTYTRNCRIGAKEGTSLHRRVSDFISRCGKATTVLCRRAIMCIIRMDALQIIVLRILSALIGMSIYQEEAVRQEHALPGRTSNSPSRRQGSGTQARKVSNGTRGTEKPSTLRERISILSASIAENILSAGTEQSSARADVRTRVTTTRNRAESSVLASCAGKRESFIGTAKRYVARRVVRLFSGGERIAHVYDITVEEAHEFFANGVLVSNCDGPRMIAFFLACNKPELADIRKVTIDRHLYLMEEDEEDKTVQELERGYVNIPPSALVGVG